MCIGFMGPVSLATIPPIRRALGDVDPEPVPLTYPSMSTSPRARRMGGIVASDTGPMKPMHREARIAGFSCALFYYSGIDIPPISEKPSSSTTSSYSHVYPSVLVDPLPCQRNGLGVDVTEGAADGGNSGQRHGTHEADAQRSEGFILLLRH
jgi:hypothetical protein